MAKGFDEVLTKIDELIVNNEKESRKAVSEATEIVINHVKPLIHDSPTAPHISAELTATGFKDGDKGEVKKNVGYKGSEAWRVHFPDSGTVKQTAQNFNDRGLDASREKVLSCYRKHIVRGLKL